MRVRISAFLAILALPAVATAAASGILALSGTVPMTAEVRLNGDSGPQMIATSSEIKSEFARKGEFNVFRIVAP